MSQSQVNIKVWDPLLRLFHWSLVTAFAVAFLTGENDGLHVYAGYTVLGLVIFRFAWGFCGGRHARFADFVFRPSIVVRYLSDLIAGRAKRYLGHNPAGGYMVVLMLLTLLVTCVSGIKAYGEEGREATKYANLSIVAGAQTIVEEDGGDAAQNEEMWEEVHEVSAYFMLALVAIHLLGVFASGRMHKENLIKAMLTGNKRRSIP